MHKVIKRTNLRRKSCMVRFLHGGINSIFPETIQEISVVKDTKVESVNNVISIKSFK